MTNHFVLSNPEFNELYNHETGEIYDKEAFKEAVETLILAVKPLPRSAISRSRI